MQQEQGPGLAWPCHPPAASAGSRPAARPCSGARRAPHPAAPPAPHPASPSPGTAQRIASASRPGPARGARTHLEELGRGGHGRRQGEKEGGHPSAPLGRRRPAAAAHCVPRPGSSSGGRGAASARRKWGSAGRSRRGRGSSPAAIGTGGIPVAIGIIGTLSTGDMALRALWLLRHDPAAGGAVLFSR